jgi:large subunit ribosomal protein L29
MAKAVKTTTKEYRAKSLDELETRVGDLKKEQFNIRFTRAAAGQTENPARIRQVRREIARVLTIANEKRRGAKA